MAGECDLAALAAIIERAASLAGDLASAPPCEHRNARTLDDRKLCNACAAYWHASMVEVVLRDLERGELYCAADRERVRLSLAEVAAGKAGAP